MKASVTSMSLRDFVGHDEIELQVVTYGKSYDADLAFAIRRNMLDLTTDSFSPRWIWLSNGDGIQDDGGRSILKLTATRITRASIKRKDATLAALANDEIGSDEASRLLAVDSQILGHDEYLSLLAKARAIHRPKCAPRLADKWTTFWQKNQGVWHLILFIAVLCLIFYALGQAVQHGIPPGLHGHPGVDY
jgi:hypothetical protein